MPSPSWPYEVLHTKLHQPRPARHLLARPRLLEHLSVALEARLWLVAAPAGYGKTSLISQWLAETRMPAAWLSLDEADSDPRRFFSYLVAALQGVAPGACPITAALLTSERLPSPLVVADSLVDELGELPEGTTLVLDDYHLVDADALHQALLRLVEHLPQHIRLIVISRSDPPWPVARLRSRGLLSEVRGAALRFTTEETRSMLDLWFGGERAALLTERLQHYTDGWAAGLQLASLALRAGGADLEAALQAADRHITDYLVDEVFERQPQHIRAFLLATALPERFCAPLVDALLAGSQAPHQAGALVKEMESSVALLERFERELPFLSPLDQERRWYRYHPLFRDLLLRRLRHQHTQEEIAALYGRAAEWCVGQLLLDEAIHYTLHAGRLEQAAALVEQQFEALLGLPAARLTLRRLLAFFPDTLVRRRPVLLLMRAYTCSFIWDVAGLLAVLGQLRDLLDASPTDSLLPAEVMHGHVAALTALASVNQARVDDTLCEAQRALHLLPATARYARATARSHQALALAFAGRHAEAVGLLLADLAGERGPADVYVTMVLLALGALYSATGEMQRVNNTGERLRVAAEATMGRASWFAWGHYLSGHACYERNDLDRAAAHFGAVAELRHRANDRCYQQSLFGLALVCLARGGTEQAQTYSHQAHEFARELDSTHLLTSARLFDAHIAMLRGEHDRAYDLVQDYDDENDSAFMLWTADPRLTRARALALHGAPHSLAAAARLAEQGSTAAGTRRGLAFLVVLAFVRYRQGSHDAAFALLDQALRQAEPGKLLRTFCELGPATVDFYAAAARHPAAHYYILVVLSALRSAPQSGAAPTLLTERERNVLALLAQRLSTEEIAEQLVISSNTVKKHTQNIFNKLEVSSRRQAIAKAQALGLLYH
jgi:LuxR family transcriptional regulator, maltose regulon positive regulatory protein